jgi:hypothetical protein
MDNPDFKNKLKQIKSANDKIFSSLLKDTELYNNIIFVYTHRLPGFMAIMNRIHNNFILVSHNSDENITDKYKEILEHPKLIFWHSQNVLLDNPKLGCLPIGITNTMWGAHNIELINKVAFNNNNRVKTKDFYFYFNVWTNYIERSDCKNKLEAKGLQFDNMQKDYESYLNYLSSHKYALCPPGNGIDCHRTWECLYLGVIPILKRSIFTEKLSKKFTCLLVDDWSEFNKEALLSQYPGAMYYDTLNLGNIDLKNTSDYFLIYQ